MKSKLHWLLVLLFAVWIAMPSRGDETGGGGNGGGTGVWILPFSADIHDPLLESAQPRLNIALGAPNRDIHLELSPEMGASVAMLLDDGTGEACLLPVVGRRVVLPLATLRVLSLVRVDADVMVFDAAQRGYRIRIDVGHVDGAVTVRVY